MKNRIRMIGIIAFIAAIGFSIAACGGDGSPPYIPPEDKPASERWGSWNAEDSTATITHSVDEDGVCTITVSGTPEPHGNGTWYAWKATASYDYTSKAGTSYSYKFEAWTGSGTRDLHLQYYGNNDDSIYLSNTASITTTRKTYMGYGDKIPKTIEGNSLCFQCADQIGTFYIKILEIKEYKTGNLTITNFLGTPGLGGTNEEDGEENEYVTGRAKINESLLFSVNVLSPSFMEWKQINGNTVTIPVWKILASDEDTLIFTFAPYTGSTTIAIGNLSIINTSGGGKWYEYTNKDPITFTNGNATINFGTQMVVKP